MGLYRREEILNMAEAKHISELNIITYRGIRNLEIDDLDRVNILLGDNNSGKTSVLEAIQILCNPCEYNLLQVAKQRDKYRSSHY